MKLMNKAVITLAVASLIGLGACKKGENKPADEAQPSQATEDTSAQTAALMQSQQKWDKSEVNGLLAFVPEDTAFVFASTRLLDTDNPKTAKMYNMMAVLSSEYQKLLDGNSFAANNENCAEMYKYYEDLFKGDLAKSAERFGLDPKYHVDQIAYMLDNSFVAKQSGIVNYSKLTGEIDHIFDMMSKCSNVDLPKPTEVKTGNTAWRVYDFEGWLKKHNIDLPKADDGKPIFPAKLAMTESNGIMTVALTSQADNDKLTATLKVADKPLTKDKLGKIGSDVYAVGYLDNIKAADKLLKLVKVPDNCHKEITDIVSNFPRIDFTYRIDDNGNPMYNDNTIVFADKAELKKIQDLYASHIGLINDKTLAGISLNLDAAKALMYVKELNSKLASKEFTCKEISGLKVILQPVDSVDANPEISQYINSFSNANVSLEKLDLNQEIPTFDFVASIEGASIGTILPQIIPELGPSFSNIKLSKGEVTDIDLTPQVQIPLKIKAYLGDTQLVFGTPTFDTKALADASKVDDKVFLRILLDYSILNQIPDFAMTGMKFFFKLDGIIGSNADGLTFNWNMQLTK